MAETRPDALALAIPEGSEPGGGVRYLRLSFRELDADSNRLARGLEGIGIKRGTRTVLMVPPGRDFFALTFALFKVGAVLVLVDPGMGLKSLKTCLGEAEPEAFIGVPKAHFARLVLGWARSSLRILVSSGRRWCWGGAAVEELRRQDSVPVLAATGSEETAAILFTSGSTGAPKGAVYTHGNFAAQVESLRRLYAIAPGEIDLPTFPLFALFAPALGMTAVIPEMDFTRPAEVDAAKLAKAVEAFGVSSMFGSPALIDAVGRHLESRGQRLPSLRRVVSAGAPVPARVVERLMRQLAPQARLHTPYGATEALPVASISSDEILGETRRATERGEGVCVGRPAEGIELRILRIDDGPIAAWSEALLAAPGEVGEIAVRGPVVTRSYFNRPEATALAKIPAPDGSFFHRMGDLGRLDARGRLWFCGRKSQRVRGEHGDLFTVPCEGVFNAHPKVRRTALVGVPRGRRQIPVLCVELEPDARGEDREALRRELLALGAGSAITREIKTILFHDAFPVDIRHNAKIFREKLAVWAARRGIA